MRVLVACECSGVVRDAFAALGHDAWSCDLKPSETRGQHIQGDVRAALAQQWDLVVAHPPCTHLSVSGMHWNTRKDADGTAYTAKALARQALTEEALAFARLFFEYDACARVAIENPVSILSTHFRKPDQIVQPYEYGHDASKRTCLWLKGLPALVATGPHVEPRLVAGAKRWANQTDSGQNRLGPSPERAALRSKTYEGIARAMAAQWGGAV